MAVLTISKHWQYVAFCACGRPYFLVDTDPGPDPDPHRGRRRHLNLLWVLSRAPRAVRVYTQRPASAFRSPLAQSAAPTQLDPPEPLCGVAAPVSGPARARRRKTDLGRAAGPTGAAGPAPGAAT